MSDQTNNIPTSFIGYNRAAVNKLLKEKDTLLETQRRDIEYLRQELSHYKAIKKEKTVEQEPER